MAAELLAQLACSPCCLPQWEFSDLLPAYSQMGFSKMEGFSEWAQARFDWRQDPEVYRAQAASAGIHITSFHLPLIHQDRLDAAVEDALVAARFAERLGARVVLLKADSKETFARVGKRFLDALDERGIGVTPVVQNHRGTAITTLDDYREVFASLNDDSRLKAVLEVGHFYRVGASWQEGWDLLKERIALIHVNDILDGQSVHYGTGQVDFAGLMRQIKASGYSGEIVVELELESRNTEPHETLEGVQNAASFLTELYTQA